jgi:hypothetical protein
LAAVLQSDLSRAEARAERAEADLDTVGHALGICYDHDHGCGGHGPVEDMVIAVKEGRYATGRAIDAEVRVAELEEALAPLAAMAEGVPEGPAWHDGVPLWYGFQIKGREIPSLTAGDVRRARALLGPRETP